MDKKLDILWSGDDFKERNYYLPSHPHIIRMTYGEAELLQKYVQKSQEGILEIGRFFGGSTYFLVESAPKNIVVTSIDIKDRIQIYNNVNEVKHSVKEMRETYAGSKYKSVVKGLKQAQSDGKLSLINKDSSKIKLGDDYVAVCDSYVVFCADKCKSSGFCYNDRYNVTLSLTAVCSSSFVIVVREGLIHEIKY